MKTEVSHDTIQTDRKTGLFHTTVEQRGVLALTDEEELRIEKEIMEYIRSQESISYYDLEEYVYDNKPEWVPLFRMKHFREHISAYLRSRRRVTKVKYPRTRAEAMSAALDAKIRHHQRINNQDMPKQDAE